MDDHRREILAQCAAVRVALDALDRAGELVTDEVEYAVAHVERWCTGEEGDEVIDEVEATVARVGASDGGNEGAFGVFVYALGALVEVVRRAQWAEGDRGVRLDDFAVQRAETVLMTLGEDGDAAMAKLMFARARRGS